MRRAPWSWVLALALAGCVNRLPPARVFPVAETPQEECPGGICKVPESTEPGIIVHALTIHSSAHIDYAWSDKVIGLTESRNGVATDVTLDRDMCDLDETWGRIVAAHELGHVLGLDHKSDRGTLMFWQHAPKEELILPTAWEREAAKQKSAGHAWRITFGEDVSAGMKRCVRWAASTWNEALGRVALITE